MYNFRFRSTVAVAVSLLLMGCDQGGKSNSAADNLSDSPPPVQSDDQRLETGIHLVARWTIEKDDLFPLFDNEIFVEYREEKYQELQDDEPEPVKYMTLDRTEFIPLELENEPARGQDETGRAEVGLTFTKDMTSDLTRFSRKYLGRQVALVIDGEVITLHKVRSVITGSGLKISRCTDDGCELIMAKLKSSILDSQR